MKRKAKMADAQSGRKVYKPVKGRRILWILLIGIVLLPIMLLESYRFAKSFRYWHHNKELKQNYIQEVSRLRLEQEGLKNEVRRLKYNTLTQERLSREMGYVKPGETVYKFTPKTQ